MEAVKKAASGAVDSIRNSPLFRRKFGTQQGREVEQEPRHLSPEQDTTPFVQGINFKVTYLGRQLVSSSLAQDHGVTDSTVRQLWGEEGEEVRVRVTTTTLRVKRVGGGAVLWDFPLFHVSYCGTDRCQHTAFSFVAKGDDGEFYCHVFRCVSEEKAYALALAVAKAFYLAYQILQEQQGQFPSPPDRECLFEPQLPSDTQHTPPRPHIPTHPSTQQEAVDLAPPSLRVTRPSLSSEAESLSAAADDDFARLAKARSNPDILRSTIDIQDVRGGTMDMLHLHADPSSHVATPVGSTENLLKDAS
ncbi:Low density lipoprotein receptor adapter protein 1 [Geodia barretti]|uniref:Low density lipoprotein receptor adapter protein 1 n=1 Tax=Geodia barretti TaxID=519541 RepID=A0AA35W930_GEOBA|nr:Low density lipoprotein receptor adapter protein 1 [Geodia barretti]